jgi:Ran GTPase-activating protein (RanGAP) involved in mRNA processing and transport
VTIQGMTFDEEAYGKAVGRMLNDSKTIRELDISNCEFVHPKCFFDMCSALLTEKCRLNCIRFRGIAITNLEAKVIQFILMKNKLIHTIDLSMCRIDNPENLDHFIQKFDHYSAVRYLTLDGITPDISPSVEMFGYALSLNCKMEVLMMRELKIKWQSYCKFWEGMSENQHLKKISVAKTDMTDRVVESMSYFLSQPDMQVIDLDLSRNLITCEGLACLCAGIMANKTIKFLNLGSNCIKDKGIKHLVDFLNTPSCQVAELSLNGNKINNEGISQLAAIIPVNKTLTMLDVGKNEFSDFAFNTFALQIRKNDTLQFLDISKNKDLSDMGSLITLV